LILGPGAGWIGGSVDRRGRTPDLPNLVTGDMGGTSAIVGVIEGEPRYHRENMSAILLVIMPAMRS